MTLPAIQYSKYLHIIYILLGIIHKLDMIWSVQEVCAGWMQIPRVWYLQ